MAEANQFVDEGVCKIETIGGRLEICLCKEKCLLGKGAYGNVYKGKWKEDPEASESTDVAVKCLTDPHHAKYDIATLVKANGHINILKFYGQVRYGPYGGYVY